MESARVCGYLTRQLALLLAASGDLLVVEFGAHLLLLLHWALSWPEVLPILCMWSLLL